MLRPYNVLRRGISIRRVRRRRLRFLGWFGALALVRGVLLGGLLAGGCGIVASSCTSLSPLGAVGGRIEPRALEDDPDRRDQLAQSVLAALRALGQLGVCAAPGT